MLKPASRMKRLWSARYRRESTGPPPVFPVKLTIFPNPPEFLNSMFVIRETLPSTNVKLIKSPDVFEVTITVGQEVGRPLLSSVQALPRSVIALVIASPAVHLQVPGGIVTTSPSL